MAMRMPQRPALSLLLLLLGQSIATARSGSGIAPAETLTVASPTLELSLHMAADQRSTFAILDRRTNRSWQQVPRSNAAVTSAKIVPGGLDLTLRTKESSSEITAHLRLDPSLPELSVTLEGQGAMPKNLGFPAPFQASPGDLLILPISEGMSYPVDDASVNPPAQFDLTAGKALSMAWGGITDGSAGMMAIVETPNDAKLRAPRLDGLLALAPVWLPEKGNFAYPRRIRYVFFSAGGYVAMCKRYRTYAKTQGLVVTLREKLQENPNVDRLVGAANLWVMDGHRNNAVALCRELRSLGMERILWGDGRGGRATRVMNQMGILTSSMDSYHDSMDPAFFSKFKRRNHTWVESAWPQDLTIEADGSKKGGFGYRGYDGNLYTPGLVCDMVSRGYARKRIAASLSNSPSLCRFIDTSACEEWNECYHPDHPMTRTQSKAHRMGLLRMVKDDFGLVVGTEQGHDAALPYVHYFEGMMSLFPYRVPDAGRTMERILREAPERVEKFQTGHYYRLPLWELVYHDCVVSYWYWGDYNNKIPVLWDRRDLFNALYGTPPMYMFRKLAFWKRYRDRFVQSYRVATPVARATGYVEMLSHEWLSADHAVQQTKFANGVVVTVNFGDRAHTLADGRELAPLSHLVDGLPH